MTAWTLLQLAPRRLVRTERRVRVRVHRPKPELARVEPVRCPRCRPRRWQRPKLRPDCRHCADTGVWTEWRTESPGRPVQHAVQ